MSSIIIYINNFEFRNQKLVGLEVAWVCWLPLSVIWVKAKLKIAFGKHQIWNFDTLDFFLKNWIWCECWGVSTLGSIATEDKFSLRCKKTQRNSILKRIIDWRFQKTVNCELKNVESWDFFSLFDIFFCDNFSLFFSSSNDSCDQIFVWAIGFLKTFFGFHHF